MPLALFFLLANTAAAWFMTGLIWFVQVAHYPQFKCVGADIFTVYHERHTRLTTWVVGPPMLIEGFSAVALVFYDSQIVPPWIAWTGLMLLAIIWISTAALQVPRHNVLAMGWNDRAARILCKTNWIRTVAWSARAVLMLYAIWRLLAPVPSLSGPGALP
jgi:hypothetical protein